MAAEPNADDDGLDDELDDDETPTTVHIADDLNEYLERQRYEAIFEAKNNAAEVLRKAGAALGPGQNTRHEELYVRERVSTAVVGYITEVRQLLEETEQGQELWTDTRLAVLPVSDAAVLAIEGARVASTDGLEAVEQDGAEYYVLEGVADYLTLHDTEAVLKYLTDTPRRGAGKEYEQQHIDPYAPVSVSRTVYQELNALVSDVGLDLDLGEPDADEWEL